ncbi:MAG: hydroxyacid dehydrogenase [Victivallaceae bacterium]|jgi:phosphoglycerate dehydrogenase-like enzyme
MIKAAIFNNHPGQFDYVFQNGRLERLRQLTVLYPEIIADSNFSDHASRLKDVEVIFSTWGMPVLNEQQIAQLPNLKALFYAAGSVKMFGQPYLTRGVRVFSAWHANAIAVAEFAVSQILLSCKCYFQNSRACRNPAMRHRGMAHLPAGLGGYGETVALIGCGMVARNVIKMLKKISDLKILVVDGYLSDTEVRGIGAEKVTLEDAFKRAYIVSNHLPDIPSTERMIRGEHFMSMRPGATFINTGRGRQVAENEMIEVLEKRMDLTALLDVTFPEPPAAESKLYILNNVFLSSHIAGSTGNEVVRMADAMLNEFERWRDGLPPTCEIVLNMLERIA